MKKKIIERLIDRSDQNSFCSALRCESCGKTWVSQPVKFSKENVAPATEGKKVVFSVLYEREREQARQKAAQNASYHFNLCPICGQMVCNDCFLVCEDLDMCKSCAERLHEKGEPVYLRLTNDVFVG